MLTLFSSLSLAATLAQSGALERPVSFTENAGQWENAALFAAVDPDLAVRLEPGALAFAMRGPNSLGWVVRLRFERSDPLACAAGEGAPLSRSQFLVGDPTTWRRDIGGFGSVRVDDFYKGVDLVLHRRRGAFEYDLELAPGAELAGIEVVCEGVDAMYVDSDGWLVLVTPLGELRQAPPATWEVGEAGARCGVESCFKILGPDRFGFAAERSSLDRALVVDPHFEWSTYLGGSGADSVKDIAFDTVNAHYLLVGVTDSPDFPMVSGSFDPSFNAPSCAFVTRMWQWGNAVTSSTYIGGAGATSATAVAIDASGNAVVVGATSATNFPTTTGAYSTSYFGGSQDGYVVVLDSTNDTLLYGSYLGGDGVDQCFDVAFRGTLDIAVVGSSDSSALLGQGNPAGSVGGVGGATSANRQAFFAHLQAQGNGASDLKHSKLLGGSSPDEGRGVVWIDSEYVALCGSTSGGLQVTGGYTDPFYNGGGDGFVGVLRLNTSSTSVYYASYLGGSSSDAAVALALHGNNVYIAGATYSADFVSSLPIYVAGGPSSWYDDELDGNSDGFIVHLVLNPTNPEDSHPRGWTFVGGNEVEEVHDITTILGRPTLVGATNSTDLAWPEDVMGASLDGITDGFLAQLSADLTEERFATYVGGASGDLLEAVGTRGNSVFMGGTSYSWNYPIAPDPHDADLSGVSDGVASQLAVVLGTPIVAPSSGPTGGGTWVEIDGNGFLPDVTSVWFGDVQVPANHVTVISPNYLLCVTPPQTAPGMVPVTVRTPYDSILITNGFEYIGAPPPPGGGGGHPPPFEGD
jgi:hypothetical protein